MVHSMQLGRGGGTRTHVDKPDSKSGAVAAVPLLNNDFPVF